jgi:hypothetical protein
VGSFVPGLVGEVAKALDGPGREEELALAVALGDPGEHDLGVGDGPCLEAPLRDLGLARDL